MKDKLIKFDWIVNNLIVHNLLKNYLNLKGEFMQLNLLNKRFNAEAAAHCCSVAVLKNQNQPLADVLWNGSS